MFELLYTSVAPKGISESALKDIMDKARLKNQSLGITGMMLYHDREIIQILEGEESKVQALFQAIFDDSRHMRVEVLYQGEIEQRAFTDWSMAFKSLDDDMIKIIAAGYEGVDKEISPISMLKDNVNRGKKTFISLLDHF